MTPQRHRLRTAYHLVVALLGVGVVAFGFILGYPLLGIFLTVLMVLLLVAALKYPVPAGLLFAGTFGFALTNPDWVHLIDVLFAPVMAGVLAYRLPLIHSVWVVGLYGILGLIDASGPTLTTDLTAVAIWVGQLLIAVAIGHTVRERERDGARLRQSFEARRSEMARTLHDSVAASLTAVVVRAQSLGLKQKGTDPAVAAELAAIAEESRQAMAQVRQLIKVLDTSERDALESSVQSLSTLVDAQVKRLRSHGFTVDTDDVPAVHLDEAVVKTVDKFLNEAATNALKYGERTEPARVRLGYSKGRFLAILSNAVADASPGGDMSTGVGLHSLRDDAESLGGTFRAGRSGPTWEARLELPV